MKRTFLGLILAVCLLFAVPAFSSNVAGGPFMPVGLIPIGTLTDGYFCRWSTASGLLCDAPYIGGTNTSPLTLVAGQAGAGLGPLYFQPGANLTTPAAGASEYDGSHFYLTPSATRYSVALGPAAGPVTFAGPTQARTITFPDAAITVARTDAANTFTGTQVISGLKPASDSTTAVQVFANNGTTSIIDIDTTDSFVGINTTAPLTRLTVLDTISTSPRGILSQQVSTDTSGARVGFSKARGAPGALSTVVTGDLLGRLMFRGYDGAAYQEMASIEIGTMGTIGSGRVPTYMMFQTATDAATSVLTERMRIDDAGNVGIGTSTPTHTLDVIGTEQVSTKLTSIAPLATSLSLQGNPFVTGLTGWTDSGAGWVYAAGNSGEASHSTAANDTLTSGTSVVSGQSYLLTYSVAYVSGTGVTASVGGVTDTQRTANGTYTKYFTATATTALVFTPAGTFVGSVYGVSLQAQGPALTACGTAPSLQQGSGSVAGNITVGAGGTGCVATFATAFTNAPACVCSGATTCTATATNSALTLGGLTAAGTYSYHCIGLNE